MYSCFISKQFGLLFVWSCSEFTLYPPDSNNLPSWKVHYFPYYFFLSFATGADSFQHNRVKCYLNCYSRLKYSVICRVYKMIICNGVAAMLPQCQKQTDKQNRGAVRGLSWCGAVKSQLSAFTATCIRITVALLKKNRAQDTHFLSGCLETLFWFHAQTSSRGAGLKELKVDVSGSQWHASAGTILTPLNLSDPSVPALSLPRCGSSKISLLQGATNYEGVNEAQGKVFCFSFSWWVKKKKKYIFSCI